MPVPAWLLAMGGKFVFSKIKAALRRKAAASVKSSTMGVAAALAAAAAWIQTHPDTVSAVVGDGWGGVVVALAALAVAIARARSLGK